MPPSDAQIAELAATLRHARSNVPFYQNAGPNLADFPVVSKSIVLSNLEEFISSAGECSRSKLAAFLRYPHPQTAHELLFDRKIVVEQTSGSSGIPFQIGRAHV